MLQAVDAKQLSGAFIARNSPHRPAYPAECVGCINLELSSFTAGADIRLSFATWALSTTSSGTHIFGGNSCSISVLFRILCSPLAEMDPGAYSSWELHSPLTSLVSSLPHPTWQGPMDRILCSPLDHSPHCTTIKTLETPRSSHFQCKFTPLTRSMISPFSRQMWMPHPT